MGTDGSYHPRIQCNGCEKFGHYVRNCPTHPDTSADTSGKRRHKPRKDGDKTPPNADKEQDDTAKYKAVSHYILGNNQEVIEYEECLGDDDDSDYGGDGKLKSFSYAQVAKGEARPKKKVRLYTEAELNDMGVSCSINGKCGRMRIVILLDSGSTHHIVKDKELLTNIRHSKVMMIKDCRSILIQWKWHRF